MFSIFKDDLNFIKNEVFQSPKKVNVIDYIFYVVRDLSTKDFTSVFCVINTLQSI